LEGLCVGPKYLKSPDDGTLEKLFNYQKRHNNKTMLIIFDDESGYPAFEESMYAPQLFMRGRQQRISVILISHTTNHAQRPNHQEELVVFRLLQQLCKQLQPSQDKRSRTTQSHARRIFSSGE